MFIIYYVQTQSDQYNKCEIRDYNWNLYAIILLCNYIIMQLKRKSFLLVLFLYVHFAFLEVNHEMFLTEYHKIFKNFNIK